MSASDLVPHRLTETQLAEIVARVGSVSSAEQLQEDRDALAAHALTGLPAEPVVVQTPVVDRAVLLAARTWVGAACQAEPTSVHLRQALDQIDEQLHDHAAAAQSLGASRPDLAGGRSQRSWDQVDAIRQARDLTPVYPRNSSPSDCSPTASDQHLTQLADLLWANLPGQLDECESEEIERLTVRGALQIVLDTAPLAWVAARDQAAALQIRELQQALDSAIKAVTRSGDHWVIDPAVLQAARLVAIRFGHQRNQDLS